MDETALDKLSEMQRACLRLVAQLKKTEQIAGELGISPSTVNTHIERAISRLQVPNRREAARLVVAQDTTRAVTSPAQLTVAATIPDIQSQPTVATTTITSTQPSVALIASATSAQLAVASATTNSTQPEVASIEATPAQPAVASALPLPADPIPCPEKHPTEEYPLAAAVVGGPPASTAAPAARRPRNDLTTTQRLLLALLSLVLLCIAIGGLGAAIEQLSQWRSSLAVRR